MTCHFYKGSFLRHCHLPIPLPIVTIIFGCVLKYNRILLHILSCFFNKRPQQEPDMVAHSGEQSIHSVKADRQAFMTVLQRSISSLPICSQVHIPAKLPTIKFPLHLYGYHCCNHFFLKSLSLPVYLPVTKICQAWPDLCLDRYVGYILCAQEASHYILPYSDKQRRGTTVYRTHNTKRHYKQTFKMIEEAV